jgi:hypothetical protein
MSRGDWLSACAVARQGGRIRSTLPNLAAAYRTVRQRWRFPDDPFGE